MKFNFFCTILFLGLICVGCGQDFNSNSYDGIGNFVCPTPGDVALCDSLEIIHTSCIRCHSGEHTAWINYESKADYVAAGLIDAGGAVANSPLITRLRLYAPSGNMPPAGYSLKPADYNILLDWVEGL